MEPSTPIPILTLKYPEEYRCLAQDCPDTCCSGWSIQLENNSLQRLRQIRREPFTSLVSRSVVAKTDPHNPNVKGEILLDAHQNCAFLDQNRLCSVHRQLGEDALPRTCRLYPFEVNLVDGVREVSLQHSCPEVFRILSAAAGALELEVREVPFSYVHQFPMQVIEFAHQQEREHFWKVRGGLIARLQAPHDASALGRKIATALLWSTVAFSSLSHSDPIWTTRELSAPSLSLGLVHALSPRLQSIFGGDSPLTFYLAHTAERAERSKLNLEDLASGYLHPFYQQHSAVLENLLLSRLFQKIYPFQTAIDVLDQSFSHLGYFLLLEYCLLGLLMEENFTPLKWIQMGYRVSRSIDHSNAIQPLLRELGKGIFAN
jgi:lysine-N-methylase